MWSRPESKGASAVFYPTDRRAQVERPSGRLAGTPARRDIVKRSLVAETREPSVRGRPRLCRGDVGEVKARPDGGAGNGAQTGRTGGRVRHVTRPRRRARFVCTEGAA